MEYLTRWLHHTDSSDSWVKAHDMGAPAIAEFRAALASRKRRKLPHAAPQALSRSPSDNTANTPPPAHPFRKRRAHTPAEQAEPQRARADEAGSSSAHAQQHDGSSHPAYTPDPPMPILPDTENRDGTSRTTLDAAEGPQPPSIHSRCDAPVASCQRSSHNFFSKQ